MSCQSGGQLSEVSQAMQAALEIGPSGRSRHA